MFQSSENRRKATSQRQSLEPKPRNTTNVHRDQPVTRPRSSPRAERTRRLQRPGAGAAILASPLSAEGGDPHCYPTVGDETRTLTSHGLLSLRHLPAGVCSGRSVRCNHLRAGVRPEAREALGVHLCCPRVQPPGLGFRQDPRFTTWGLPLSPGFT